MAPHGGFVAAQALELPAVEIGKTQEAASQRSIDGHERRNYLQAHSSPNWLMAPHHPLYDQSEYSQGSQRGHPGYALPENDAGCAPTARP